MDSIGTLVAVFFFDGGNWTNSTRGRIETSGQLEDKRKGLGEGSFWNDLLT